MRVYLSGGMHSGWQDRIIERYPMIEFIDPRKSGMTFPADYTAWDMRAIDLCDFVIAYLEEDNPSGAGLAFEIGYALGRGITVYFANEKEDRYFEIVNYGCTEFFESLRDLIKKFDISYMNREKSWLKNRNDNFEKGVQPDPTIRKWIGEIADYEDKYGSLENKITKGLLEMSTEKIDKIIERYKPSFSKITKENIGESRELVDREGKVLAIGEIIDVTDDAVYYKILAEGDDEE